MVTVSSAHARWLAGWLDGERRKVVPSAAARPATAAERHSLSACELLI
jgi:hypothetical protein